MFEDLFTVEHVCNVLHMENHECVHNLTKRIARLE